MTNPSFAYDRSMAAPEFGAMDVSPALVAEILLKRRRVRRSLIEWCRHCGYEPAPHHMLLIDRLERVAPARSSDSQCSCRRARQSRPTDRFCFHPM
jgi:hypothetical protein